MKDLLIHTDAQFQVQEAQGKTEDSLFENSLLYFKSHKGFPVYNTHYKILEDHILNHVKQMNQSLRSNYVLNQIKSSAILQTSDPTVQHYISRFPQKQFLLQEDGLALKPACCANAFKTWGLKKSTLKRAEIIHEVSDCYRDQNLGTVRTLSRSCYFTMPDYHMITVKEKVLEDFNNIRTNLKDVYTRLFGPEWPNFFRQIVRIEKDKFEYYRQFLEQLNTQCDRDLMVELLTYEDPLKKPYFELKYELAYTGGAKLFTLGTIQIDYLYPELFGLDTKNYTERVALHFTQGSIPRIIKVLAMENRIPKKGVKVFAFDKSLSLEFLDELKCSKLMDNTSKNILASIKHGPMELKFFPLLAVIGPLENENKTVSIMDRNLKTNYTISQNQFLEQINSDGLYTDQKETYFTSTNIF